jgi:hypothetical protein
MFKIVSDLFKHKIVNFDVICFNKITFALYVKRLKYSSVYFFDSFFLIKNFPR